jgi:hypothetical protein
MFKNLGRREFYQLKRVLHYMPNHGLSLEEARAKASRSTEGVPR